MDLPCPVRHPAKILRSPSFRTPEIEPEKCHTNPLTRHRSIVRRARDRGETPAALTFRSRPPGPRLAVAASGSRGTSRRPALYMGDSTCPGGWSPLAPSERAPSRKLGLIVIPKVSGTTGGPRWQWAVAQHEHRAPSGLWWRCETLGEPVYIHKRFHKDVTRRGRGTYGLAARLERPVRGAGTGGGKPQ